VLGARTENAAAAQAAFAQVSPPRVRKWYNPMTWFSRKNVARKNRTRRR
jgi:hypothetical protein